MTQARRESDSWLCAALRGVWENVSGPITAADERKKLAEAGFPPQQAVPCPGFVG